MHRRDIDASSIVARKRSMTACHFLLPTTSFTQQSLIRNPPVTLDSRNAKAPRSLNQSVSLTRNQGNRLKCRSSFGGQSPEQALKSTVELNNFIDTLRSAPPSQLGLQVAQNVLAFDRTFWLHLAARADSAQTPSEQQELQELAGNIMGMVEQLVLKTQEKMNTSTDVLTDILSVVADGNGEIDWPPRNPEKTEDLRKAVEAREMEGLISDEFLAAASAQLRQSIERGDRPGLSALLQKLLQVCASIVMGKRSYATRPDGSVDQSEVLLEEILRGEEEEWEDILRRGLVYGGGSVSGVELLSTLDLRMERTLMRTEGGSYEQRVVGEYLREVEERSKAMISAFETPQIPIVNT